MWLVGGWVGRWVDGWVGGWSGYNFLAYGIHTHLCHHEVHDEDMDVGAVSPGQHEEEEHPHLQGRERGSTGVFTAPLEGQTVSEGT